MWMSKSVIAVMKDSHFGNYNYVSSVLVYYNVYHTPQKSLTIGFNGEAANHHGRD